MNYWLVKFAPFRCGWQDILRNGQFEIYSVRNAQARNNLNLMKINDEVLFYHSQEENCIMGKMIVTKEAHQDPTTSDERWLSVTFEPTFTFSNPLPLKTIREVQELANIGLIRQPRLSVMQIEKHEFDLINDLSETSFRNV